MNDNLLPPRSNDDKNSARKKPGPIPSHLRPESEDGEPPIAPPTVTTAPAKVEGRYCPYCDELISVNAIKCKHCQSMLENPSPQPASLALNSSSSFQVQNRSRRNGPKGSNVGLQLLAVLGIAGLVGVGFLICWSLYVPTDNGSVKSNVGNQHPEPKKELNQDKKEKTFAENKIWTAVDIAHENSDRYPFKGHPFITSFDALMMRHALANFHVEKAPLELKVKQRKYWMESATDETVLDEYKIRFEKEYAVKEAGWKRICQNIADKRNALEHTQR